MTRQNLIKRIDELIREINKHNYLYYVKGEPEVPDAVYDALVLELKKIEEKYPDLKRPDSPTHRIGGSITKDFPTRKHLVPMLSLDNAYSFEELQDFDERIQKLIPEKKYSYLCELKIDGVSLSVHYKNGILDYAVTRGDGIQGDDITPNVKTIKELPLNISYFTEIFPEHFEVRGEVYMTYSGLEKLNKEREELGEPPLMNPRNGAAGSLKLQDSTLVAKRNLKVWIYELLIHDENFPAPETAKEALSLLEKWGFKILPYNKVYPNIRETREYIDLWNEKRYELDFPTDGIVLKINELPLREILGTTSKSPRWAIAYKFPAEKAVTTLESVDYQVGRTGYITPVANLTPVLLAGTIVKRASLYNFDEIERLDLHEKDKVEVLKSGEIIPKIVRVLKEFRKPDAHPVVPPSDCPVCQTSLIHPEGEVGYYCPNIECEAQIVGRLEHFAGKDAMDIKGLGEKIVLQLRNARLIKLPADLYELNFDQLVSLERFKEKSANNLLNAIRKSKERPFHNVLFALGIRHVGIVIAQKLTKHFKNIHALQKASVEEIAAVYEIGEVIGRSVHEYLHNEKNWQHIERLIKHGLKFEITEEETEETPREGLLQGKTLLVSGTIQGKTRNEVKKFLQSLGAKYASGVSSKLDYLILGEKPGASKVKKARELGIPIISYEEFLEKLEKNAL